MKVEIEQGRIKITLPASSEPADTFKILEVGEVAGSFGFTVNGVSWTEDNEQVFTGYQKH